jgi:hypothetical protein
LFETELLWGHENKDIMFHRAWGYPATVSEQEMTIRKAMEKDKSDMDLLRSLSNGELGQ